MYVSIWDHNTYIHTYVEYWEKYAEYQKSV